MKRLILKKSKTNWCDTIIFKNACLIKNIIFLLKLLILKAYYNHYRNQMT
jgi:hypothetical protein